jgi:hypothetical protein
MTPLEQDIKQIIIEWLDGMYDADGEYPNNPDYRNENDVNTLTEKISEVVERKIADVVENEVLSDTD